MFDWVLNAPQHQGSEYTSETHLLPYYPRINVLKYFIGGQK